LTGFSQSHRELEGEKTMKDQCIESAPTLVSLYIDKFYYLILTG